jgi:hypothetical protein
MGGGKGTVKAETPKPITTTTSIGSALDAAATTFDEGAVDKEKSIDKKRMGTRGLQIPMTSTKSSTLTGTSPASTGVQV